MNLFIAKEYFYAGFLLVLESFRVVEIDIAIFQGLECFEKERSNKMAIERLRIFVWENSEIS